MLFFSEIKVVRTAYTVLLLFKRTWYTAIARQALIAEIPDHSASLQQHINRRFAPTKISTHTTRAFY